MHDFESAFDRISSWLLAHRYLTIVGMALLCAGAIGGIFGVGLEADFSPQALFTTFEDQIAVDEAFAENFGKTENVIMVVVQGPDVTSLPALQYQHDVARALSELPVARRVESLTTTVLPRGGPDSLQVDSPVAGDTVEEEERVALLAALPFSSLAEGSLLSESRQLAIVAIFLREEYVPIAALAPAVDQIQVAVDSVERPDAVAAVDLAGIPELRVFVVRTMLHDQRTLVPLSLFVSSLILLLTFRWIPGLLLPIGAVGLTVVLTVGAMAWFHEPFNILNQMLPIMLIIIGTSDAIHLLSRYREEIHSDPSAGVRAAARRTMVAMAVACFLTSFTTGVGFASLMVSRTDILRRFGIAAALGVLIAYFVTIVLVPPLLTFTKAPREQAEDTGGGLIGSVCEKIAMWAASRPVPVLIGSAVFCCAITYGATFMNVDTHLLETFPPGTEVNREVHLLEDELDGVLPYEISITSQQEGRFDDPDVLNAVYGMEEWLREQVDDGVLSVTAYPDLLYDLWTAYSGDTDLRGRPFTSLAQVAQLASLMEDASGGPLDPWITFDRRHLRIGVKIKDLGSRRGLQLSHRVTAELEERFADVEDVEFALTGDAYSGARGITALVSDLSGSLGTALVIIFLFMTLLFRSLRMGLISVPPNLLPLVATMAWMAMRDINLNTSTVLTFSVAIGLAVDDTIHMLARFREEYAAGASVDEAIRQSGRGSGRAIVITSAMLVAGLLVMLNSSFVPIKLFAELLTVTIITCLVGDLVMLPALLKQFWPERSPAERDRIKAKASGPSNAGSAD
jgi:hypothetical protein